MIGIVSVIALGVACFVGFAAVHRNLSAAKDRFYANCRMADFWVDLRRAPRSGERCVVYAWSLGLEDRRGLAGCALHSDAGGLCAVALATWISLAGR